MIDILGGYFESVNDWVFGKPLTFQEQLILIKKDLLLTRKEIGKDILRSQLEMKMKQDEIREKSKNDNISLDDLQPLTMRYIRIKSQISILQKNQYSIDDFMVMLNKVKTMTDMTSAFGQLTKALSSANRQFNPQQLNAMMMKYDMLSDSMKMAEEMINEKTSDMFDLEEEEQDAKEICAKVLDEMGIRINEDLPQAPKNKKNVIDTSWIDDDEKFLAFAEGRMENLKKL